MRLVGAAERGMRMMAERALQRRVFGKLIAQQGSFLSDVAKVTPAFLNCYLCTVVALKPYSSQCKWKRSQLQLQSETLLAWPILWLLTCSNLKNIDAADIFTMALVFSKPKLCYGLTSCIFLVI